MTLQPLIYMQRLAETVAFLQTRFGNPPEVAFVLGSGLGDFVDEFPGRESVPFSEVPNFPRSTVEGHSGRFVKASLKARNFCVLQGRVHLYEGISAAHVVFPVRALALWGVDVFVITNAAGAVNEGFHVGDLMLISDHVNLLGGNPLLGPNLDQLGERFPDMVRAYDREALEVAVSCGNEVGLKLRQGVYGAVLGPSYETPAEIRMLRVLGVDAVGMSTVPEVIALRHLKKMVLGISCITNMAAGILEEPMKHGDVLKTTQEVKREFAALLVALLERLPR